VQWRSQEFYRTWAKIIEPSCARARENIEFTQKQNILSGLMSYWVGPNIKKVSIESGQVSEVAGVVALPLNMWVGESPCKAPTSQPRDILEEDVVKPL
jgi:hypothetical protein